MLQRFMQQRGDYFENDKEGPMHNLILRKATHEDMDDILYLQLEVFKGEQEIPAELLPISAEKSPQWWCAIWDTALVGTVAAWKVSDEIHWGRFATMQSRRGLQIGSRLARFSLNDLFSQSVEEIHIDAREITVKILSKMGGLVVGEPTAFYQGTVTPMILSRKNFI